MERIYKGSLASWKGMMLEFSGGYGDIDPDLAVLDEPKYVFGAYHYEFYEGDAFAVYSDDGETFFMAGGSHCSCYGLENQWEPIETNREALLHMFTEGTPYGVHGREQEPFLEWLQGIKTQ